MNKYAAAMVLAVIVDVFGVEYADDRSCVLVLAASIICIFSCSLVSDGQKISDRRLQYKPRTNKDLRHSDGSFQEFPLCTTG